MPFPLVDVREEIKKICIPNGLVYEAPNFRDEDGVISGGLSALVNGGQNTLLLLYHMYQMHSLCQSGGGNLRKNIFPMFCWDGKPQYVLIDVAVAVPMVYNCVIRPSQGQITWQVCE